jgi:hypothetical protein
MGTEKKYLKPFTQKSYPYSKKNTALEPWVWLYTGWDSQKNLQKSTDFAFGDFSLDLG